MNYRSLVMNALPSVYAECLRIGKDMSVMGNTLTVNSLDEEIVAIGESNGITPWNCACEIIACHNGERLID